MFQDFIDVFTKTFITDDRYVLFFTGIGNTILITIFASIIGIAIGAIIAIIKVSKPDSWYGKLAHIICDLYTTIIRGTPVLLQLLLFYFVILRGAGYLIIGVAAFGFNSGAYVAEAFRAGLLSIDKGQTEAGRSLGLTQWQVLRKIILPQAIKNALPSVVNEQIALLKETSVIGYVGGMDLIFAIGLISSRTFDYIFPLICAAIVYLTLVILLTYFLKKLERRLRKGDKQ